MGIGYMKNNDNVYFRARKDAADWDERLFSREGAADALGVSVSTLADYELGNTKVVPVDKVVLMADLYACPELKTNYCKCECPIGKQMPIATKVGGLEGVVLHFLREFDETKLNEIRSHLIEIGSDGVVDPQEAKEMQSILGAVDRIALAISELRLYGEKQKKG